MNTNAVTTEAKMSRADTVPFVPFPNNICDSRGEEMYRQRVYLSLGSLHPAAPLQEVKSFLLWSLCFCSFVHNPLRR